MRPYLTIHTPAHARHHASGAWTDDTLASLLAGHARTRPDHVALVDLQRSLTWAEALDAVRRVAGWLRDRRIGAGDPVMVQLRNSATFAVADLALSAVGAVIVPTPLGLHGPELMAVAERVRPVLLVSDARRRGGHDQVARVAALGIEVLSDDALDAVAFAPDRPLWHLSEATGTADDVLDLMFTSGTTGTPKGILNTTNSKLSALRPMVAAFGLDPGRPWLVVPPMTHNAGWLYSYLPALLSGAPSIFLERFDAAATLDLLDRHAVAEVFFTPTHARDVLDALGRGEGPVPRALRHVFLGGADTPPELKATLRERLSTSAISLYGATENQAVTFVRPEDPPEVADHTVGRACPGHEVAIFGGDDRATLLPPGAVGEVGSRGPGTFAGYYDDQGATFGAFNRDGWYFAGDLGLLDAAGNLSLRGRSKELIIRGGRNIVPDDVEQALEGHPDVERVCAVALPEERLGEVVCAAVIARRPDLTLASLVDHLRERQLGSHLWPEALLLVDSFPHTDAGKVRRRSLQEAAVAAADAGTLQRAGR